MCGHQDFEPCALGVAAVKRPAPLGRQSEKIDLPMKDVMVFCLVTGVLSTVALDVWVTLVGKLTGRAPTNWGMVGRWLLGMRYGQWVLRGDDRSAPSQAERALGWAFHYLVGISYSVLVLLGWGPGFVQSPTVLPVVLVGLVLSTIAGLTILMPGLGAGFLGSRLPDRCARYVYLVLAHTVFAAAMYGAALLVQRYAL